jgi:hypothetical protein
MASSAPRFQQIRHSKYSVWFGLRGQCKLFSVVFTRSPTSHHGCVWVLPVISLLLTIAGAGLPIHIIGIIGDVFVGPKNEDDCGPLSIQSSPFYTLYVSAVSTKI